MASRWACCHFHALSEHQGRLFIFSNVYHDSLRLRCLAIDKSKPFLTNDLPLFHTLPQARPNQVIDYAIHESPVLYDKYDHDPSQMCTPSALKSVLKQGSNPIGALSSNHRPIVGQRHADVIYDYNIKLYEGMDNYVINKSFVIRQGDSGADHRCATIIPSNLGSQKAGAIPCEFQRYPDCLVGAVGNTKKCVFKPCVGFRQYWSDTHFVNESTLMCKQAKEWYPKPNMPLPDSAQRVGTVDCTHGQHTLLTPIGPHSDI